MPGPGFPQEVKLVDHGFPSTTYGPQTLPRCDHGGQSQIKPLAPVGVAQTQPLCQK